MVHIDNNNAYLRVRLGSNHCWQEHPAILVLRKFEDNHICTAHQVLMVLTYCPSSKRIYTLKILSFTRLSCSEHLIFDAAKCLLRVQHI
jgi:hypothetical protein